MDHLYGANAMSWICKVDFRQQLFHWTNNCNFFPHLNSSELEIYISISEHFETCLKVIKVLSFVLLSTSLWIKEYVNVKYKCRQQNVYFLIPFLGVCKVWVKIRNPFPVFKKIPFSTYIVQWRGDKSRKMGK